MWVLYILFTLACISYSPSDPPSPSIAAFGAVHYHNWIGAFGAHIAYAAMQGVGPGVFVGIVVLGIALVLWIKGDDITQLPLRVIGGAMLVAVVSTLFNMMRPASAEAGWDAGDCAGEFAGVLL